MDEGAEPSGGARRGTWPHRPELDSALVGDGVVCGATEGVLASGVMTDDGSVVLVGDTLLLIGVLGAELCRDFLAGGTGLERVACVDARRVTSLHRDALALLAGVARPDGPAVPLWAGPAVLRAAGREWLERRFDLR